MESYNTQNLTAPSARPRQDNKPGNDDFLRSSLEKINERLDRIESNIAAQNPEPGIQNLKSNHFSQEKFTALEELSDQTINGLKDEKACPYEPTGKPCDHCAMCSSRGF